MQQTIDKSKTLDYTEIIFLSKGLGYNGVLINGMKNGVGFLTDAAGNVMNGAWVLDDFICGKIELVNGEIVEGAFRNGLLDGLGYRKYFINQDDFITEIGFYSKGKLLSGTKKSDRMSYEGNFVDGKLNGPGKVYGNNKLFLEGTFEKNELFGEGKIFHDGFLCEQGEYKNNLLHGHGKVFNWDGSISEGLYINGQLTSSKMEV